MNRQGRLVMGTDGEEAYYRIGNYWIQSRVPLEEISYEEKKYMEFIPGALTEKQLLINKINKLTRNGTITTTKNTILQEICSILEGLNKQGD